LVSACLAAIPALLAAEAYKCVIDGQTVYSQQPCAKDAQAIDLYARPPLTDGSADWVAKQRSYVDDYVAERRHMRRLSALDAKKERLERKRDLASDAAKYGQGPSLGSTIAIRQSLTNLRLDLEREIEEIEREIEDERARWAQHTRDREARTAAAE
jgi:hypothetical protein